MITLIQITNTVILNIAVLVFKLLRRKVSFTENTIETVKKLATF